ncbi:MAG: 3-hydroxyacyl-CoA dehydrogenase NAD-binding domain-containing protein [Candidatus Nitrosocaldus sp.]|nr:3-hydroxyacyl-CoA dehydrogenase [Candidatus Nitrosocaldus sp.]MCS7140626.1 3-hydroxyacyl-CoA dehydrogenase [Candidatus Nitrosocaldus sp.]MDW7999559.1 3-hydroxyacyl-CoA dehydrogenase NAD-binding domain-containing protein [Candidatus Nitrosocaldus sp.]MDW8276212.1 3-hydroxyacyl-CoA dehydrogenase NAD-binding domain-containing protein [Candidatus Nitrosocaldus sp.]
MGSRRIERVAVLGSGIMGHGIAQISAMAGYRVTMRDVEQQFLDKAMERIRWSLGKMVEKGRISSSEMDEIMGRISVTVDIERAVKDSDLVIEAIPEEMRLKKETFARIDALAPSHAVFASNTSTLPITEMADATKRGDRFIGIHFFNPPQLMQLVEIIPGASTSTSTVDIAMGYVRSLKKEPILCRKDVAGFIVNRIFIPLVHEAAWELKEGKASMREIDAGFKFRLGFPMGIFELADYTGIDVVHKATKEMYSRDRKVVNPCPLVEELYAKGHYGQKSGKGFYEYGQGSYARIELSMQEAERYDPVRLLAVAINNASWLISNDVAGKEDVERALILGMGLKEGIFAIAGRVGYARLVDTLRALRIGSRNEFYEPDSWLLNLVKSSS